MERARPRILSAGGDLLLFETRNRVLEAAGFDVIGCLRGLGAREWYAAEQFDAVVLGCFEDPGVRRSLIDDFKRRNSRVPILVVYRFDDPSETYAGADRLMESLAGPETLISTVVQMTRFPQGKPEPNDMPAANAG